MSAIEAKDLTGYLAGLRRHARMSTGSTKVGDTYVQLALELVVSKPESLEAEDPRLLLYQALYQVRDAIAQQIQMLAQKQPTNSANDIEQRLQGLSAPFERRVLMLSTVDQFSTDEIATILHSDSETVETALAAALATRGDHAGQKVVIIEDEPLIAEQIAEIASELGLLVVGIAAREDEAKSLVSQHEPSLILSDVHLKDEDSGIRATWSILQNRNVPVVFITGFPDALLTGDQSEPEFVVAKPFDPETLRTTIARALEAFTDRDQAGRSHDYLLAHLATLVNQLSWKVSDSV